MTLPRLEKELAWIRGEKVKRLSQHWFERPKRKKRIAKKLMDRVNRSRALITLQLQTAFSQISSESRYLRCKALARRIGARPKQLRKYFSVLLIHKQCNYNTAVIWIRQGNIRTVKTVRASHVDWYRQNHDVSKVFFSGGVTVNYDE